MHFVQPLDILKWSKFNKTFFSVWIRRCMSVRPHVLNDNNQGQCNKKRSTQRHYPMALLTHDLLWGCSSVYLKANDAEGAMVTSQGRCSCPAEDSYWFPSLFTKCYQTQIPQREGEALQFPQWTWGNQHRRIGVSVSHPFGFFFPSRWWIKWDLKLSERLKDKCHQWKMRK